MDRNYHYYREQVAGSLLMTIMVIMRNAAKASVAEAKAHLSELDYRAERRGRPTIICRRGRPVAVIAPIEASAHSPRSPEEAVVRFEKMIAHAPANTENIRDAMGRNRCD